MATTVASARSNVAPRRSTKVEAPVNPRTRTQLIGPASSSAAIPALTFCWSRSDGSAMSSSNSTPECSRMARRWGQ